MQELSETKGIEMMNIETANKFIVARRKHLKELLKLEAERMSLNKQIRQIKRELDGWDRHLLNEGD